MTVSETEEKIESLDRCLEYWDNFSSSFDFKSQISRPHCHFNKHEKRVSAAEKIDLISKLKGNWCWLESKWNSRTFGVSEGTGFQFTLIFSGFLEFDDQERIVEIIQLSEESIGGHVRTSTIIYILRRIQVEQIFSANTGKIIQNIQRFEFDIISFR